MRCASRTKGADMSATQPKDCKFNPVFSARKQSTTRNQDQDSIEPWTLAARNTLDDKCQHESPFGRFVDYVFHHQRMYLTEIDDSPARSFCRKKKTDKEKTEETHSVVVP